ncbi:pilus assembly protein [Stieleria sp. ICT_E10.1]|uniref:TadE/TadG family type IV pilus assembly protein n=1 Tax=Stieleria sedimenti TaxID=2976331 RepID=UPI00217F6702|nr:pilus assembly protein [Stieleria sedimenti]MCS7467214.1 pilus assembly protein [Stieleria sedimenti]
MKSRFRKKQTRRGAATVEFALIVPVMLTFTFGLIEMGRISMIKEAVVQASREGARVGIRPTASIEDVQTRINEELAIMNLTSAVVTITPSFLEEAEPGDDIKVRITIPISEVSYVPGFFSFEGLDIVAETVMRRESTG